MCKHVCNVELAHVFLVRAPVNSCYVPKFMYSFVRTGGAQALFCFPLNHPSAVICPSRTDHSSGETPLIQHLITLLLFLLG